MRILLVVYDNGSHIHVFPMGSAYIAAVLRKAGHEVVVYNQDQYHYPESYLTKYLNQNHFDIVGLGIQGGYYQYKKLLSTSDSINRSEIRPLYILGGHCASPEPEYFLKKTNADIVVIGEGERTIIELLEAITGGISLRLVRGIAFIQQNQCIITGKRETIQDLDSIPYPAWDLFPMDYYSLIRIPRTAIADRVAVVLSGRDCPYSCLVGDTIIDTMELGKQKIKDLVGKDVKVLTRNPDTKEVEYAPALNICRTSENRELVRIHFNDDSHIDCTPDHKFLRFINGNQNSPAQELETEAQDLRHGDSVRAIIYFKDRQGYEIIKYGRGQRLRRHRLIMEGFLNRKLTETESMHHLDMDKYNNSLSNLRVVDMHQHTKLFHPEVSLRMKELWKQGKIRHAVSREARIRLSERMKLNNPMHNPRYRKKATNSLNDRIRSGDYIPYMCTDKGKIVISKIARERALSENNPLRINRCSPNKRNYEVNHKVLRVERLSYKADVYCMEVPGYDWFFANEVLVHNCNFCYRMTKGYRPRSAESIIEEIRILKKDYQITFIDFLDDLLMTSPNRAILLSEAFIRADLKIKWSCNGRLNFATPEVLDIMKHSGCIFINYGIESLDDDMLKVMNKKLTVEQITRGVEATLAAGISPGLNIIWGNKNETKQILDKGVNFLLKYDDGSQLRTIRFVTPYPGSELYYDAIKMGLLKDCEDFYENKHKNSDLLTINFTKMSDEEMYDSLFKANQILITNYYQKKLHYSINEAKDLYFNKDISFRGFRQT